MSRQFQNIAVAPNGAWARPARRHRVFYAQPRHTAQPGSRRSSTWHSHAAPPPRRRGGGGPGRWVAPVFAILVIVAAIVAVLHLTDCSGASEASGETPAANVPVTTAEPMPNAGGYNWSCLRTLENGRLAYVVGDETKSKFGIDVSEHQGEIDWQAAAADGVQFAFIRLAVRGAEVGNVALDECYERNVAEATAAGVPIGVYVFSQAVNEDEAREEAQFAIDHLGGVTLTYPVVLDFETLHEMNGRANGLSTEQATANALAFCQTLEAAGYPVMIYGNYDDLARLDQSQLRAYPIWFAAYSELPFGASNFAVWQYSETGHVNGIDANVDLDIIIEL